MPLTTPPFSLTTVRPEDLDPAAEMVTLPRQHEVHQQAIDISSSIQAFVPFRHWGEHHESCAPDTTCDSLSRQRAPQVDLRHRQHRPGPRAPAVPGPPALQGLGEQLTGALAGGWAIRRLQGSSVQGQTHESCLPVLLCPSPHFVDNAASMGPHVFCTATCRPAQNSKEVYPRALKS